MSPPSRGRVWPRSCCWRRRRRVSPGRRYMHRGAAVCVGPRESRERLERSAGQQRCTRNNNVALAEDNADQAVDDVGNAESVFAPDNIEDEEEAGQPADCTSNYSNGGLHNTWTIHPPRFTRHFSSGVAESDDPKGQLSTMEAVLPTSVDSMFECFSTTQQAGAGLYHQPHHIPQMSDLNEGRNLFRSHLPAFTAIAPHQQHVAASNTAVSFSATTAPRNRPTPAARGHTSAGKCDYCYSPPSPRPPAAFVLSPEPSTQHPSCRPRPATPSHSTQSDRNLAPIDAAYEFDHCVTVKLDELSGNDNLSKGPDRWYHA